MKKILPALALFVSVGLFVGCGDDDDNGTGPGTGTVRLQAVTSATAPSDDPSDTVWNAATAADLGISATTPIGGAIASLASTIETKAIVSNNRLYLRLEWADASHNVWRGSYLIESINQSPPFMTFTSPGNQIPVPEEDQVLVMFSDPSGTLNPDVWNWRALTTDAGGVAEGMTLNDDGDSLISDSQPNALVVALANNQAGFAFEPFCVHPDLFDYDGYIVYINDRVCKNDTIVVGTDTTTWTRANGWQIDDRIPGFIIDSLVNQPDNIRGSRWDIDASHSYSGGIYAVVMSRELNTGSADDLNLSSLPGDSVQVQLGLLDNQNDPFEGTSTRGFSPNFWLILP